MPPYSKKEVKELREFNIDIFKLKDGLYDYEFDIKDDFFEFFNFGIIERGEAKAFVEFNKTETLIDMKIKLKGKVELICDRTLEPFDFHIDNEHKILFKFGEKDEEVTDEILVIERHTQRLNIAQHVYDFISLSVPIKKIHPRFQTEDENPEEEGILIYSSQEIEEDLKNTIEEIDPRWNALKKLKNDNNN